MPDHVPSSPFHPVAPPLLALGLLVLAAAGCRGTPSEPERTGPGGEAGAEEGPPAHLRVQKPWTLRFLHPAQLVADEVRIEGPDDLLEHVAVRQDPAATTHRQQTTELGLLLTTEALPGLVGVEIRAQLDALEIVALRRLVVLQRPGEVAVTVRASGDVWYRRVDGSDEQRAETLELSGERGR